MSQLGALVVVSSLLMFLNDIHVVLHSLEFSNHITHSQFLGIFRLVQEWAFFGRYGWWLFVKEKLAGGCSLVVMND